MVFEDFNGVDKKDILFMKHLFPIFKANDVLLFVLVRDEATANQLLELNGWGRIAPLQGICNDVCSPGDKGGKCPNGDPSCGHKTSFKSLFGPDLGVFQRTCLK